MDGAVSRPPLVTANAEKSFSSLRDWQDGHAGFWLPWTSASKAWPQAEQRYSNRGTEEVSGGRC